MKITISVCGEKISFDSDAWALDYGMDPQDTDAIRADIKQAVISGVREHYDSQGMTSK